MNFYAIEDLGERFSFLYDAGAGVGIWEDNIGTLYTYLEGDISPDFNGEDEERGIYKPWNLSIDRNSSLTNL